jgi:hypothetical protein
MGTTNFHAILMVEETQSVASPRAVPFGPAASWHDLIRSMPIRDSKSKRFLVEMLSDELPDS